ncbi:hypothetical protein SAY86_032023 [Trapa natans]|uniref:Uncharacterized protein n=1 Tax=Trapa natans TaxID=22666 RepID=A0AAN7LST0_TRANT|nr:hypothetical protein SAY86_032023 [Trapa natans]
MGRSEWPNHSRILLRLMESALENDFKTRVRNSSDFTSNGPTMKVLSHLSKFSSAICHGKLLGADELSLSPPDGQGHQAECDGGQGRDRFQFFKSTL